MTQQQHRLPNVRAAVPANARAGARTHLLRPRPRLLPTPTLPPPPALAPAAVETEVMDHVMETVKETRSEPQRVEHRIKEAGVAEIAE